MSKKNIIFNPNRQADLLAKLVQDTCSRVPEKDRGIHLCSVEALVWNLFKGGYDFSVKDVKFIIEAKIAAQNA